MGELIQLDQLVTLWINGSQSLFWDNLMITVTNTFAWSLLIVMLFYVILHNNDAHHILLIFLCIALMIFVADRVCSGLVKPTVARWRPTQDPQLMYLIDTVNGYRGGRFGFFSGHASNTFCVAHFWLFCSVTASLPWFSTFGLPPPRLPVSTSEFTMWEMSLSEPYLVSSLEGFSTFSIVT